MAKKATIGKPFTYRASAENYLFLLDKQAEYKKKGKPWGLSKMVDLCINNLRIQKVPNCGG